MSHWWSSKQELILVQIWVVLILSHIVYARRRRQRRQASKEIKAIRAAQAKAIQATDPRTGVT